MIICSGNFTLSGAVRRSGNTFGRFKQGGAAWAVLAVFVFSCVSLYPTALLAVPANPDVFETLQPDGKKIKIHLRGDEHFSWHEDANGYVIQQDKKDSYWKYARPKSDIAGFDIIDDANVGSSDPVKLKLKKGELPKRELLRERFMRFSSADQPADDDASQAPVKADQFVSDGSQTSIEPPPLGIPVSGTKTVKNIVILASFSDHWNSAAGTVLSAKGRVSTTEYTNLFNQTGHTSDSAVGSVKDYYREVSYGKLTVDSTVTPWVKLPNNEAYYGANDDANAQQMVADAIAAAEAAGFNFSQGDSDGDGWVDGLTIIHSGHAEEYGGNPSDSIWSHQGEMSSVVTADGVKLKRYHTEPALRGLTSSTAIIRIGVIAHEMGHFFGLPDLYDYSDQTNGLGDWCLMAGGSWNGSDGKSPAHFSAWAKAMLGFVTSAIQHAGSSKSLSRVEDNAVVHLYRDGMSNGEYFLVENRAKYGFDNTAEIYTGIVIYHVDTKSSNNDLATWPHPAVKIEEADGNNSLGLKSASSQLGDVWTSTSGIAGGFRDMTGIQSSNAMLYQSHFYNRSNSSASYSYIRLKNFSAPGIVMTYTAETLRPEVADVSSSTGNYSVTWGASSNAMPYEIQEGSETTAAGFSDGAESETAMYENWAIQGDARRSSGGFRTGASSYVFQFYDNATQRWYSSVQGLTMRNAFTVKNSTVISFYYKSNLNMGDGYLKYQVSKDGGNTWLTLGTQNNGQQTSWTQVTCTYANLNSLGIAENDQVIFRFIAEFEAASGWTSWPSYGYAIDDLQISNTEMKSYGNWTTLASNVGTNSYAVSGKGNGRYAYQVRAYANSVWQEYSLPGIAAVTRDSYTLAVSKSGTGSGTVTSSPAGISCGGTCGASFSAGQSVTLTAAAASGSVFAGWSGACSGTGSCVVAMDADKTVTAAFNTVTVTHALTVAKSGTGSGTVTSSPAGISCGGTCGASFSAGQSVTLTAAAASGSVFAGWSGACSGAGSCVVAMDADKTVTADFTLNSSLWTNGQAATLVLGQPGFDTNDIGTDADKMVSPAAVAVDPATGKVFVADKGNHRVLRFASGAALTNGAAAEAVLGQPDFFTASEGLAANKMNEPFGVGVDSGGHLWVADGANERILRFDNAVTKANGADADGVLGQADFTSNTEAAAQNRMNLPVNLAVDADGRLWVSDQSNNRVLRFDNAAAKANGADADGVLGQADFTSQANATTRNGMYYPAGLALTAAGVLFVADMANERVLRFDNAAAKANGADADGVLGQADFTNNLRATARNGMDTPFGLSCDSAGRLYVADYWNSRVLIFNNAAALGNGADAGNVLGQADFTTSTPNAGGCSARTLSNPTGVFADNATGALWVADHFNSRVLRHGGGSASSSSVWLPAVHRLLLKKR